MKNTGRKGRSIVTVHWGYDRVDKLSFNSSYIAKPVDPAKTPQAMW